MERAFTFFSMGSGSEGKKFTVVKPAFVLTLILLQLVAYGQVPPYTLQGEWTFGEYGYIDLRSGTPLYNESFNRTSTAEASTAISDTNGTMVFYSNSSTLRQPGAAAAFVTCGNAGGNSSTSGSVAFPSSDDPNKYFFVSATDNTSGQCGAGGNGMAYSVITNTAGVLTSTARTPLATATSAAVNEALCAGADGNGGYWVATRAFGLNEVWVWHFTTAAAAPTKSTLSVGVSAPAGSSNAAIKFSKCMDKIGWFDATNLQVYNWNNATGTLGTHILTQDISGYGYGGISYGFEFSPDGNYCFISTLHGLDLVQIALPGGAHTVLSTASSNNINEIGSMQMGPDDKIYVTNAAFVGVSGANIGVISGFPGAITYNSAGATLPTTASPVSGWATYAYRGLANVPWLNPKKPIVSNSGCNLSFVFENYFRNDITVNTGSIEWSHNNGTTWVSGGNPYNNYPFPGAGTYNVRVRVRDATCNILWTSDARSMTVSCSLPVNLLDFYGQKTSGGNTLTWLTSGETDCKEYLIQRSTDGQHFETVGTVACKGNKNVATYTYTDFQSPAGQVYYQLTQIDNDQTAHTSSIISVGAFSSEIIVNANHADNSILVSNTGDEIMSIAVSDVTGKYVDGKSNASKIWNSKNSLSKGVYLVSVYSENDIRTVKVVIE